MTLDGLERAIHAAVPRRSRVNFVRYADDFIITGKSKHLLEKQVMPVVEAFLAQRGLALSKVKTRITHIKSRKLNQALRGWAYYHRHVVASRAYNRVDQYVYEQTY